MRTSADELDRLWDALTPEQWAAPVRRLDCEPSPAADLVWSREREVEVHAVDLDVGYEAGHWPAAFVERLLDGLVARQDLPPLAVEHDGRRRVTGEPYDVVVNGTPPALALWLTGRSTGVGLVARGGPLPRLPEWD